MSYLTKDDLATHIYAEVRDAITRNTDDIVTSCINQAIAEAKSYLSRYDLEVLFDDTTPFDDENLKSRVKDIAIWRLVRLSNPNVDIELARTNYTDAIDWLKDIQKGIADPAGWPYPADDAATDENENNQVQWNSNAKRNQHY